MIKIKFKINGRTLKNTFKEYELQIRMKNNSTVINNTNYCCK